MEEDSDEGAILEEDASFEEDAVCEEDATFEEGATFEADAVFFEEMFTDRSLSPSSPSGLLLFFSGLVLFLS